MHARSHVCCARAEKFTVPERRKFYWLQFYGARSFIAISDRFAKWIVSESQLAGSLFRLRALPLTQTHIHGMRVCALKFSLFFSAKLFMTFGVIATIARGRMVFYETVNARFYCWLVKYIHIYIYKCMGATRASERASALSWIRFNKVYRVADFRLAQH